ncbi:MAG: ABC transporter ATP-binding protein [Bacteroidales bacterium]
MPLLELNNLSIGYVDCHPHKVVHESINLTLKRGEFTCLLGMNGAGKSTLLKTLGGFQPQLSGDILLEGKSLSDYSRKELAKKLGVVLTDRVTTGNLTVYELVSFGRYVYTDFFGRLSTEDHKVVGDALRCVGIESFANRNLLELSDGERQKAMIAKAIAQVTPLIILDEPTAFLDLSSRVEIMLLLRKLAAEEGKTVLLSTHDLDLALQLSDKIWIMAKRREIACGVPEDLALAGTFNSFFDKDNLSFDLVSGSFKINSSSEKEVSIQASGETLIWLEKALCRKGFKISSSENGHSVHQHNSQFEVRANGKTSLVNSIDEVLNILA